MGLGMHWLGSEGGMDRLVDRAGNFATKEEDMEGPVEEGEWE